MLNPTPGISTCPVRRARKRKNLFPKTRPNLRPEPPGQVQGRTTAAPELNAPITLVRRTGEKVTPVGKAEVLRASSQKTLARRITGQGMAELPVRAGDQAIVRFPSYSSLGEQ